MNYLALAVTSLFLLTAVRGFAQPGGELTPPGAPGKTFKSLDEVEPRIPVVNGAQGVSVLANGTIQILEPGSFYLTTNLDFSGEADGIQIQSSDVSLDLNGFTISGDATGPTINGIEAVGPLDNISVINGVIRGFPRSILFLDVKNSRIEGLRCTGSTSSSLALDSCGSVLVSNCSFSGSASATHISILRSSGNTIESCSIEGANTGIFVFGGSANRISDCRITASANGISVAPSSGSIVAPSNSNIIEYCTVSQSSTRGISISANSLEAKGNLISHCTVSDSGSIGIVLSGDTGECIGNEIRESAVTGSGSVGVLLAADFSSNGKCNGNVLKDCVISESTGYGVLLQGDADACNGNLIRNNAIHGVDGSPGVGIDLASGQGNRIESNQVSGVTVSGANTTGIRVTTTENLIINNTCFGQNDNFDVATLNMFGDEFSTTGGVLGSRLAAYANFSLGEVTP